MKILRENREIYFLEISTNEYLSFKFSLCPSFKTISKMNFFKKAKNVINNYTNIVTLITFIQKSEKLSNFLIYNDQKTEFNHFVKNDLTDKIGIFDKFIFSKKFK